MPTMVVQSSAWAIVFGWQHQGHVNLCDNKRRLIPSLDFHKSDTSPDEMKKDRRDWNRSVIEE